MNEKITTKLLNRIIERETGIMGKISFLDLLGMAEELKELRYQVAIASRDLADMTRQRDEALAALKRYGKHSVSCAVAGDYVIRCDCGLDKALSSAARLKPENQRSGGDGEQCEPINDVPINGFQADDEVEFLVLPLSKKRGVGRLIPYRPADIYELDHCFRIEGSGFLVTKEGKGFLGNGEVVVECRLLSRPAQSDADNINQEIPTNGHH